MVNGKSASTVNSNGKGNTMKQTDTFDDGVTIMVPMATRLGGKGSIPINHAVTFVFKGCTLAHVMSLCVDAAKVKLQDKIRKHPASYPKGGLTISVNTLGIGATGVSDEMMAAWYRKLTPAARKRMLGDA